MSTLSTHVLDAVLGRPAAGVDVVLRETAGREHPATTDADGRVRFDVDLEDGAHRLVFASGAWFAASERETFHPEITVSFTVDAAQPHVHVALLLSPFSYTTYRGS